MKKLLRILTVHSIKELLRYKSFLLLVFFLLFTDRILHHYLPTPISVSEFFKHYEFGEKIVAFIFTHLPKILIERVFTVQIAGIALVLFALKQVISLWPTSDMRHMHRNERGRFGIFGALTALRWHQVAWDALAVATVCSLCLLWFSIAYLVGFWSWLKIKSWIFSIVLLALMAASILPLAMAGFSFSSKLAVIQHGTFVTRFRLFLKLFTYWPLLWTSWSFFIFRIMLELIFVAIIPIGAMLYIKSFWLRILVATVSATPIYSYLKMATFKFFLEIYADFDLVRAEYLQYYRNHEKM